MPSCAKTIMDVARKRWSAVILGHRFSSGQRFFSHRIASALGSATQCVNSFGYANTGGSVAPAAKGAMFGTNHADRFPPALSPIAPIRPISRPWSMDRAGLSARPRCDDVLHVIPGAFLGRRIIVITEKPSGVAHPIHPLRPESNGRIMTAQPSSPRVAVRRNRTTSSFALLASGYGVAYGGAVMIHQAMCPEFIR